MLTFFSSSSSSNRGVIYLQPCDSSFSTAALIAFYGLMTYACWGCWSALSERGKVRVSIRAKTIDLLSFLSFQSSLNYLDAADSRRPANESINFEHCCCGCWFHADSVRCNVCVGPPQLHFCFCFGCCCCCSGWMIYDATTSHTFWPIVTGASNCLNSACEHFVGRLSPETVSVVNPICSYPLRILFFILCACVQCESCCLFGIFVRFNI